MINHSRWVPLVSTGEAARELGVSSRVLRKWAEQGVLIPDLVTPGGHYRWNIDRIRAELQHPSRRHHGGDEE